MTFVYPSCHLEVGSKTVMLIIIPSVIHVHQRNQFIWKSVSKRLHLRVYIIEKTDEFEKWFRKLKDSRAKAKILFRIQRIEEHANFGDCEPVGQGISELRIHYAKGYRLYLKEHNDRIVLLLNGGNKSTQQRDIAKAKQIWNDYRNEKK